MRPAFLSLVLALPLGSCATVMEGYGDHVIYADGHAWHTWPAKFGVGVFANVTPVVLLPLLGLEVVTGTKLGFADACTATALAAGVVLGTPTYVLGLPFASCAEQAAPARPPASVADHRYARVVAPDPREQEVELDWTWVGTTVFDAEADAVADLRSW